MTERWIRIRGWDRFQHYGDRTPPWIKNYTELMSNDAYVGLSFHARGVLHGLWLEYAASRRQLPDSTLAITRRLGGRVSRATLESLKDAGFIEFSASRPLAPRAHAREVEVEVDPPNPPNGGAPKLSQKQVRKYTGCRLTRGSHGFGFVRDPLGIDKPPPDWPYERPSKEEVGAALAATTHGRGEAPLEGA